MLKGAYILSAFFNGLKTATHTTIQTASNTHTHTHTPSHTHIHTHTHTHTPPPQSHAAHTSTYVTSITRRGMDHTKWRNWDTLSHTHAHMHTTHTHHTTHHNPQHTTHT